jgi:hypothetical protein
MYCERRQDISFGWEQPELPFHNQTEISENLSGNMVNIEKTKCVIHDYKTCCPKLIVMDDTFFGKDKGTGTLYIPARYCIYCGRKLGEREEKVNEGNGRQNS